MLLELPAVDHFALHIPTMHAGNAQLDAAVREQDAVARRNLSRQTAKGCGDQAGGAIDRAWGDRNPRSGFEGDRQVMLERPGTDLGSLQILKDRYGAILLGGDAAQPLDDCSVLLMGAMGEV